MSYLVKKLDNAHVVWFQASNQWAQFDELQWLIFSLYTQQTKPNDAERIIASNHSLSIKTAQGIVNNLYQSFGKLFNPDFKLPVFVENSSCFQDFIPERTKRHRYSFNSNRFEIAYGSPYLESYIHLPLSHLEVGKDEKTLGVFEVFPYQNKYILRVGGVNGIVLSADEPGQIKRLLYIELSNLFYKKTENDWMAYIHGSAVKRNDKLLVLTSPGGSGKSTMAALLQLNGFEFFSDDFIPVEATTENIYPFPAALCVKNNVVNILESKNLELLKRKGSELAYLRLKPLELQTLPQKLENIVFIHYSKSLNVDFSPISTLEALQNFMQEAWVGDDLRRAENFIEWFAKLNFYKLEYGNSEEAIKILTKLVG